MNSPSVFSAVSPQCASPFEIPLSERLPKALDELRAGRPIVLMDDEDRENEADLIFAAQSITHSAMAMLIRDCSGIVCLCLADEMLQRLSLAPMVASNESRYGTAFTVSIEAREGVTTGVSAKDRVTTILAALTGDPRAIVSPGHVFPLRAQAGGVLTRRGHTEGSVDLARLAGLSPAGVLCELTNPDGSMTKGLQVYQYAQAHALVVLSIAELADYLQISQSS
jgi:3,4-dihydroxy 2-butanone 4-phosphate synthase